MPPTATMRQPRTIIDLPDGIDQHIRSFEAVTDSVNADQRSIVAIINTDAIDRYRTLIVPTGANLEGYRKNPVVLWEHGMDPKRGTMPIGKNQQITVETRSIKAKTVFKDDEYSREIFKCYQEGWLRGWSVRMVNPEYSAPTHDEIRSRPALKDCNLVFRKWELGEYSATAIPGNADTLTILSNRGIWIPDNLRAMTDSQGGMAGGGAALKPNDAEPNLKRFVKEIDGKWHVMSEEGKSLGEYGSREEAEHRLQQIEYFKHEDKAKDKEKPRTAPFVDTDGSNWWIDDNGTRSVSFADAGLAEECLRLMQAPADQSRFELQLAAALGEIRRSAAEMREDIEQHIALYTRGTI